MEYALLRSLRVLGPGLILLGYADLFLFFALGDKPYFWELDTAKIVLAGYVVGGLYGALTAKFHREQYAFEGVNQALLRALDGVVPGVSSREWKEVSPCFYHLIDNDKSLEQKSKGIYFNGLVVTSSFDAIWISLVASVIGAAVAICRSDWYFLLSAVAIQLLAYYIWRISLKRHCHLSEGQVAVIKKRFQEDFRNCVEGKRSKPPEGLAP